MPGDNQEAAERAAGIEIEDRVGTIPEAGCIELLEGTPVGRIGFVADGRPIVLPVNYQWFEGTIVFRTVEGQILSAVADGVPVCFEVDEWDAADQSGWSVVVQGEAREVSQWAEAEILENIGLVPWTLGEWRRIWIRVTPSEITGRVLVGAR